MIQSQLDTQIRLLNQPDGQPTEGPSSEKGDDGEVTDVDFEEVK